MIHIPCCADTTVSCCTIVPFIKGTQTYYHDDRSWCGGIMFEAVNVCLTSEEYERAEYEALEQRIIAEYEAD